MKTLTRSDTTTFSITIKGVLTKRIELFNEAIEIRDRLAKIKNDIGAIDRTLETLGYTGDLDAAMPRQKREVIFKRGELTKVILAELRYAEEPLGSRDIARLIITSRGEDARDRKYITGLTRRVCASLRGLKRNGVVRSTPDNKGNLYWELRD